MNVEQRIYRGKLDGPKTTRSKPQVALSPETQTAIAQWKKETATTGGDDWVFPSEKMQTPFCRDNLCRRAIQLKPDGLRLGSANFQVMRRSMPASPKAGTDPKLVADQLGHGLGVNS